jgi:hypothetical protein
MYDFHLNSMEADDEVRLQNYIFVVRGFRRRIVGVLAERNRRDISAAI